MADSRSVRRRSCLVAVVVAAGSPCAVASADDVDPGKLGGSAVELRLRQLEAKLAAHEAKLDAQQAELDRRRKELDKLPAADAAALDPGTTKEPTFRIYGFIDLGLQKLWTNDRKCGRIHRCDVRARQREPLFRLPPGE